MSTQPAVIEKIRIRQAETLLSRYEQIVQGVIDAIDQQILTVGDLLPSVNTMVAQLNYARKTVVRAYNELKRRGLVESRKRLGYFVRSQAIQQSLNVMLLLTAFDHYHEQLYNSLLDELHGRDIFVDVFFHHCNPQLFQSICLDHQDKYGRLVVTPFKHRLVGETLRQIDPQKLLLVTRPDFRHLARAYVVQEFASAVEQGLMKLKTHLNKYRTIYLVFSKLRKHPKEIVGAFEKTCTTLGLKHAVLEGVTRHPPKSDEAYFVIDDKDLIRLVKACKDQQLALGRDVGILSYNETDLKEIIGNGITTLSVDFATMGRSIGRLVKEQKSERITLPTTIIDRRSI